MDGLLRVILVVALLCAALHRHDPLRVADVCGRTTSVHVLHALDGADADCQLCSAFRGFAAALTLLLLVAPSTWRARASRVTPPAEAWTGRLTRSRAPPTFA